MNVILLFANSDITVCFADQKIKAHKFVLAARGDHWSNRDLNEINQLELAGNSRHLSVVSLRMGFDQRILL